MADDAPPGSPMFLCRPCQQGIWAIQPFVQPFVLVGMGAAHVACLERRAADDLTEIERSRVIRLCWDHPVAACEACGREYRITEMGNDMLTGRYYFCPCCRPDLRASTDETRSPRRACCARPARSSRRSTTPAPSTGPRR